MGGPFELDGDWADMVVQSPPVVGSAKETTDQDEDPKKIKLRLKKEAARRARGQRSLEELTDGVIALRAEKQKEKGAKGEKMERKEGKKGRVEKTEREGRSGKGEKRVAPSGEDEERGVEGVAQENRGGQGTGKAKGPERNDKLVGKGIGKKKNEREGAESNGLVELGKQKGVRGAEGKTQRGDESVGRMEDDLKGSSGRGGEEKGNVGRKDVGQGEKKEEQEETKEEKHKRKAEETERDREVKEEKKVKKEKKPKQKEEERAKDGEKKGEAKAKEKEGKKPKQKEEGNDRDREIKEKKPKRKGKENERDKEVKEKSKSEGHKEAGGKKRKMMERTGEQATRETEKGTESTDMGAGEMGGGKGPKKRKMDGEGKEQGVRDGTHLEARKKWAQPSPSESESEELEEDPGAGMGSGEAGAGRPAGTGNAGAWVEPRGVLAKMRERLSGGRFRALNEALYTMSGTEALRMLSRQPELFDVYHEGFRTQTVGWAANPVDLAIGRVKALPKSAVVGDFGCGDARLMDSVPNKVHSFDLVARRPGVTACNMSSVPLPDGALDIAVFSLALMGSDYGLFLEEAARTLKKGGRLWIAEVRSRFALPEENVGLKRFVAAVRSLGFESKKMDQSNRMFVVMEFLKKRGTTRQGVEWPPLKPCEYKRR